MTGCVDPSIRDFSIDESRRMHAKRRPLAVIYAQCRMPEGGDFWKDAMTITKIAACAAATLSVAALALTACTSADNASTAVETTMTTAKPATTPKTSAPKVTSKPAPVPLGLGEQAQSSSGAVTLHGVDYPVTASGTASRIQTAGKQFAVADLEVCPSSSTGISASNFRLAASDAVTYTFWNVQVGAQDPNITNQLHSPAVGVCARGFLTFEVDPGKTLSQFMLVDGSRSPIIWSLT
ncbi:hypothetical protein O5Y_18760 [Rhodococcus erythropolis CCM2595]|nr:hypothetical protein O5Y_18760 [Rhodococcus erythropolis CCM2595]SUE12066.1 Uncharacterised protein [Rhodococcus erythropolis]